MIKRDDFPLARWWSVRVHGSNAYGNVEIAIANCVRRAGSRSFLDSALPLRYAFVVFFDEAVWISQA